MKKLKIISFAVLALSLNSCRKDFAYVEPVAPPITTPVLFATQVYPLLTAYGCDGCHTGGAPSNLDFASVTAAWTTLTASPTMVNTVAPSQSDFYVSVNSASGVPGGNGQMPMGGSPLSSSEQATILAWITQGALNN